MWNLLFTDGAADRTAKQGLLRDHVNDFARPFRCVVIVLPPRAVSIGPNREDGPWVCRNLSVARSGEAS